MSLLAEETYRFPFSIVTAGAWLSSYLAEQYGASADHFDFGADTSQATPNAGKRRNGICFYSRPETPRRCHELAVAALRIFAADNPGSRSTRLDTILGLWH